MPCSDVGTGWHIVKGEWVFVPALPVLRPHHLELYARWDMMEMPATVSDELLDGKMVDELSKEEVLSLLAISHELNVDNRQVWKNDKGEDL